MEKLKCPYCNEKFDIFGMNCHIGQIRRFEKLKEKKQTHYKQVNNENGEIFKPKI